MSSLKLLFCYDILKSNKNVSIIFILHFSDGLGITVFTEINTRLIIIKI